MIFLKTIVFISHHTLSPRHYCYFIFLYVRGFPQMLGNLWLVAHNQKKEGKYICGWHLLIELHCKWNSVAMCLVTSWSVNIFRLLFLDWSDQPRPAGSCLEDKDLVLHFENHRRSLHSALASTCFSRVPHPPLSLALPALSRTKNLPE